MLRRNDLDAAKGIGMLLVIVGHTQPPELVATAIYGIHMPLFFFISGILWRGEIDLKRSAIGLWKPFVLASLLSWLLWLLKQQLHEQDAVPWWGPLLATVYGGDVYGFLVHNTPLWFLPAMFSLLATIWLLKKATTDKNALIFLAAIGLLTLLASVFFRIPPFPMSLTQGLIGGIFFAAGQFVFKKIPAIKFTHASALLFSAIIIAIANGRVDLFSMHLQNPILYLLSGILGSWAITALCKDTIFQQRLLCRIGRQSLLVLAIHLPLLWIIRAAVLKLNLPTAWWLLSMICLMLMIAITYSREALMIRTARS